MKRVKNKHFIDAMLKSLASATSVINVRQSHRHLHYHISKTKTRTEEKRKKREMKKGEAIKEKEE